MGRRDGQMMRKIYVNENYVPLWPSRLSPSGSFRGHNNIATQGPGNVLSFVTGYVEAFPPHYRRNNSRQGVRTPEPQQSAMGKTKTTSSLELDVISLRLDVMTKKVTFGGN